MSLNNHTYRWIDACKVSSYSWKIKKILGKRFYPLSFRLLELDRSVKIFPLTSYKFKNFISQQRFLSRDYNEYPFLCRQMCIWKRNLKMSRGNRFWIFINFHCSSTQFCLSSILNLLISIQIIFCCFAKPENLFKYFLTESNFYHMSSIFPQRRTLWDTATLRICLYLLYHIFFSC